jgi:hypothetical protein
MSEDRLTPVELGEIEHQAKEALQSRLIEQAWGRKALRLVREIQALKLDLRSAEKAVLNEVEEAKRLRALLKAVYPLVDDRPGTEELQAQLEREVRR